MSHLVWMYVLRKKIIGSGCFVPYCLLRYRGKYLSTYLLTTSGFSTLMLLIIHNAPTMLR